MITTRQLEKHISNHANVVEDIYSRVTSGSDLQDICKALILELNLMQQITNAFILQEELVDDIQPIISAEEINTMTADELRNRLKEILKV